MALSNDYEYWLLKEKKTGSQILAQIVRRTNGVFLGNEMSCTLNYAYGHYDFIRKVEEHEASHVAHSLRN